MKAGVNGLLLMKDGLVWLLENPGVNGLLFRKGVFGKLVGVGVLSRGVASVWRSNVGFVDPNLSAPCLCCA